MQSPPYYLLRLNPEELDIDRTGETALFKIELQGLHVRSNHVKNAKEDSQRLRYWRCTGSGLLVLPSSQIA